MASASPDQLNVLHERYLWNAACCLERAAPHEQRLVPIGHARSVTAEIKKSPPEPCNVRGAATRWWLGVQPETADGDSRIRQGGLHTIQPPAGQAAVGVEEQVGVGREGAPSTIELWTATWRATHDDGRRALASDDLERCIATAAVADYHRHTRGLSDGSQAGANQPLFIEGWNHDRDACAATSLAVGGRPLGIRHRDLGCARQGRVS